MALLLLCLTFSVLINEMLIVSGDISVDIKSSYQDWQLLARGFDQFRCMSRCVSPSLPPVAAPKKSGNFAPVFNLDPCPPKKYNSISNLCRKKVNGLQLSQIGNKQFYYSVHRHLKVSWHLARKLCHMHGLELGALDSPEQQGSIEEHFRSLTNVSESKCPAGVDSPLARVWTAGTNLGDSNRSFFWSDSGQDVRTVRGAAADRSCVVVTVYAKFSVTSVAACESEHHFFCQVPERCFSGECAESRVPSGEEGSRSDPPPTPSILAAVKTVTPSVCSSPNCGNFSCTGTPKIVKELSDFPAKLGTAYDACDRRYVFSKTPQTHEMAQKKCCSVGMQLLDLGSREEMECVLKLAATLKISSDLHFTSGSNCLGNWTWCSSSVPTWQDNSLWIDGQPESSENKLCASLKLAPENSGLTSGACDVTQKFICKGTTPKPMTCDRAAACSSEDCQDSKDGMGFAKAIGAGVLFGAKKKICGKLYYFSKLEDTFLGSKRKCCAEQMQLLELETREEFECVTQYMREKLVSALPVWIGGANLTCGSSAGFQWCHSGRPVEVGVARWAHDKPSRGPGEDCLALHVYRKDVAKTGFSDQNCSRPLIGACESES